MHGFTWKDSEKKLARRVFERARLAELDALIQTFKAEAAAVADPDQLWALVDAMHGRRRGFEQKFDFRYSVLPMVFARLLAEGNITEADLQGLDADKQADILRTAQFLSR